MEQNTVGEETHLAIETSGHGALKENHWLDDGAYLMVNMLAFFYCFKFSIDLSPVDSCCQWYITVKCYPCSAMRMI